jgi:hypothetical protein
VDLLVFDSSEEERGGRERASRIRKASLRRGERSTYERWVVGFGS